VCSSDLRFCADNLSVLKDKKLGLFICGMADEDDARKQLESSFPKELLAAAVAREFFGGACNYEKMNFMESFIMKKITGSKISQSRIAEDNIIRFSDEMKNA